MTRHFYRTCDACGGKIAGSNPLLVVRQGAFADSLLFSLGEKRGVDADLCSWTCVRDFAILQLLDSQPATGEEPST